MKTEPLAGFGEIGWGIGGRERTTCQRPYGQPTTRTFGAVVAVISTCVWEPISDEAKGCRCDGGLASESSVNASRQRVNPQATCLVRSADRGENEVKISNRRC